MQNSRFTSRKGFVFSLDAAVSIILVIGALFLITQSYVSPNNFSDNSRILGQDAFASISKTGYLSETLDSNSLDNAAILIRQKMLDLLPQNLDARIELKKYDLNASSCRTDKDFDSCFLQTAPIIASAGPAIPQKNVFSSKKLLIIGQKALSCDLDVALAPSKKAIQEGILFFSDAQKKEIYLQEQNPLQIDFNVTINPSDVITCDQNVEVAISIGIPQGNIRAPVNVMLVLDRSGSMSWSGKTGPSIKGPQSIWVDQDTNKAFVAAQDDGVFSFDINTPLIPVFLDSDDPGQVNDVFGKQNRVFATETQGTSQLFAYDTANPANMAQLGNISFETVYGVFINGNYAYVAGDRTGAGNDRGLYIVDISNPASMQHLGHVNLTNAEDVFAQGNTAFVARLADGVTTVDISNPNSPVILSTANPGGSSNGIFASGNYAYVAAGSLGLAVIDATNPSSISVAATHTPSYTPDFTNVYVQGAEAYVSDSTANNSNLYIVNISNPQAPAFARRYSTPYTYTDIQIKGNSAFMPIDLGLVSVDIFDGPKLSNLQTSATAFVDYNGFSFPPDKMGLVTYANNGSLDVPLGSSKGTMKTGINDMVASGETDVAPGINRAKNELTSSSADANALKFIVLLGDGKENPGGGSGGQPALNAAQQASDANIIIYTIGFGKDADANLLTEIAEIGNGKYYQADDKNALQEVFKIIAQEINKKVADVNVSVPSIGGALVLNQGTGALVDGNLSFQVGVLRSGETF